jgi:hypothetical protein
MGLREFLIQAVEILDQLNIPYIVTGAVAVSFYGLPRTTHDIDLVIELKQKHVTPLVKAFSQDFYIDSKAVQEAISRSSVFNVIDTQSGLKIDFWIARLEAFDRERFRRRHQETVFDRSLWLPSPEDVILSKLLWYKGSKIDKHFVDAKGVWDVMVDSLDASYLREWADRLSVADLLVRLQVEQALE